MIVEILIKIANYFVKFMVWALPEVSLPEEIPGTLMTFINYAMSFNGFLPMKLIIYFFGFAILIETSFFFINLIFGIISLIRGGGKIKV